MTDMGKTVRIAYRKLKSSVYFDKTQLSLLDRIVEFELEGLEGKLDSLAAAISAPTEAEWKETESGILECIGVLAFPKTRTSSGNNLTVFNGESTSVRLHEVRHYIDLPVEGHILGALWCMAAGGAADGRRADYVPNIFEPYYLQYENWRNHAIESAQSRLTKSQDALILAFDFQYFFYALDIRLQDFDSFFEHAERLDIWQRRLNGFVFDVICRYSDRLRQVIPSPVEMVGERNVLPFGFLPSYVLSRKMLTRLDDMINTRRQPVFYGRFNGNLLIVDELGKNSTLYKKYHASRDGLSPEEALEYYFMCYDSDSPTTSPLLPCDVGYTVNNDLVNCHSASFTVRKDRIGLFYFREGATGSLLNCFRSQFVQTDMDFDYLPALEEVFIHEDYSKLYRIVDDGSQYAPRRVTDATLDRGRLYDFLDKYRRISSLIQGQDETSFERELLRVFSKEELIDNYFIWERLFEILVINDNGKKLAGLTEKIVDGIAELDIPEHFARRALVQGSLMEVLHAALCRASSISYSAEIEKALADACLHIKKARGLECPPELLERFTPENLLCRRFGCCTSRMTNKYLLPLPVDCMLENLRTAAEKGIRLHKLADALPLLDTKWQNRKVYHYCPYVVTPQELSFALACTNISSGRGFSDPKLDREVLSCLYSDLNFPPFSGISYIDDALQNVDVCRLPESSGFPRFVTSVGGGRRDTLRVAIGNARISIDDMSSALKGGLNRSYERYHKLCQLMDIAIEEGVELLVLPECYLPFEWIPTVSRLCASRQMGLITGVEHVTTLGFDGKPVPGGPTYNLTAVILPYKEGEQRFSYVSYHSKVQFSPDETLSIERSGLAPAPGDGYQLFHWHDVWFSVYCCFELASINERALFHSLADITVAVEWNRDVTYFNSIIDSLCRDLHCYCIQVNSSDYGDSCVLKPAGVNHRDLIKSKGGTNQSILVGELDIAALREFQLQEYDRQLQDKTFKPTPPLFSTDTVKMKQSGKLWEYLKNSR